MHSSVFEDQYLNEIENDIENIENIVLVVQKKYNLYNKIVSTCSS